MAPSRSADSPDTQALIPLSARLVRDLDGPGPLQCIIGANDTNATFGFRQMREDERWNHPGLDIYKLEKPVVIDIMPPVR